MGLGNNIQGVKYELVAASQSTQTLGTTGAKGDTLMSLVIVPETTGAQSVAIKDGSDTAINVFVTGTLSDLHTIVIPFGPYGIKSAVGAWQVTTGTNAHVIAIGKFS